MVAKHVAALLGTFCVLVMVCPSYGQFAGMDTDTIRQVLNQMTMKDKALLLVSFITTDTATFDMVQDILLAAFPILSFDKPPGLFLNALLPWSIDHLPELLKNEEFLGLLRIFIEELNSHGDVVTKPGFIKHTGNKSVDRDDFMNKLFSILDYGGMAAKMLAFRDTSEFLPYNSTTRPLDGQCYMDTMTFIDKLRIGEDWALNMFDAVGKPTMGINRGVLYFMGSYDECLAVHALPRDVNGSRGMDDQYDFKGRYCRATFDPPRSLIEMVAGEHINETHGIPLTLSWGMCLPDSCSENDIEGLLNLGLLGDWFNITVKEAHCAEDQKFEEDTKAHAVLVILGGLLGLVIICSVLDIIFFKPKSRNMERLMKNYALSDMPMYDNMGFGDDTTDKTKGQMEMSKPTDDAENDNGDVKPVTDIGGLKPVMETELGSNGFYKPGQQFMNMTIDSDLTSHGDYTSTEQGRVITLIRGFSVFTNIPTLLDAETKAGDISCLYGIRVVTMAFIVLANTFLYTVLSVSEVPVSVNLMDSFSFMDRWTFQPILQASLNTDTFFVISGCLTSYWFLIRSKSLDQKLGGKMWLKFYFGRYWKMTPPYMLVMVLFVYLYMYLGQGPMWPDRMNVADKCQTDWWKHLLYISNLVGVDGVAAEDQCMAWSWYLAVNMQFYLIAPLFLSLLVYSSSMGLLLILIIGTAGVISAGVKESEYGGDLLTTRTDHGDYWNNIFIKPWCRVAPFCVGLVLGFLIYRRRVKEKPLKKWIAAICWVSAVCLATLVLYCQYTKYVDSITPWDRAQNSAFEALSRPVWAMGVGWVIYACCDGYAGPFNDFFSWRGFVPLSRMTFLVYLLHPIVIVLFTYSKRALININDFEMIYLYIGHLVLSYAGAFLACLVFDLPFRNIRRVIQGKPIDTPY